MAIFKSIARWVRGKKTTENPPEKVAEPKLAGYVVTVAESGETFVCNEGEKLLEAMRRTGKGPVSYGCFGGGCGVCKVKITSGRYEVVKKMSHAHVPAEAGGGVVLACCVTPCENITVSHV